ncbi:MAG: FapA family protein [Lachnospiraceae bacterium]|nr:FapA family protein [Lachnospiraceae bacterium]
MAVLDANEDKTLYAPDILANEMLLIKKRGLDIELIQDKKFNIYQLAEIRKGLENGVDVKVYLDPEKPWNEMEEIRLELQSGIDMSQYRDAGFDIMQLAEIREGLQAKLDVTEYARVEFFADQMKQIRLGLEAGIPVIFYQDASYNWLQMAEIRIGLEHGTDISKYAAIEIPYMKMRVIRESLEDGLTLDERLIRNKDAATLEQIHLAYKEKIDITKYVNKRFDADQLEQIRKAKLAGIEDIDRYFLFGMRGECMHEILLGMEQNLDVGIYADERYGWRQMRELRIGLEHQIDVKPYAKPLYRADQMHEIRLGIEANLDVSLYSSMVHPAQEMRMMRKWLEAGKTLPSNLSKLFTGKLQDDLDKPAADEVKAWQFLQTEEGRHIDITDDHMKCYFTIPVGANASRYTLEHIVKLLFKARIKKGISRRAIEEMIESKKYGVKTLVASGRPPQNGQDGYYDYMLEFSEHITPDMSGSEGADFSKVKVFTQVKLGDKLAVYHPATAGVDGYDLTGKIIKAKAGKGKPIIKGQGFMLLSDKKTYVSSISGVGRIHNGEIRIDKVKVYDNLLNVREKVAYEGSIWVRGDIDNAYIQAKGDIIVDGSISCADVHAGGRVVVRKSIVGNASDRTIVTAGGLVAAAHVDNADIVCGDDLVSNDCLNCKVSANGKVIMLGDRGLISGGLVTSLRGVETAILGSKTVKDTIIRTGITEEIDHEYQDVMRKLSRTYQEIKLYESQRSQLQNFSDSSNKQALQIKIKVNAESAIKEAELETLKEQKDKIEAKMESVKDAKIIVSGLVFSGTAIKIGNRTLRVHETRESSKGITFRIMDGALLMLDGEKTVARS